MKEPMTLRQALAAAEGLKSASDNKVRILKQKEGQAKPEEFIYDLNAINKGKAPDPFLEPNDVVAVSQDNANVFHDQDSKRRNRRYPVPFYKYRYHSNNLTNMKESREIIHRQLRRIGGYRKAV